MPAIQLVISMDETGSVNVNGPIQNLLLCYGLLEMAKVAINDHAKQNQRLVQPVTLGVPGIPPQKP
jgi:hypothetical protein